MQPSSLLSPGHRVQIVYPWPNPRSSETRAFTRCFQDLDKAAAWVDARCRQLQRDRGPRYPHWIMVDDQRLEGHDSGALMAAMKMTW